MFTTSKLNRSGGSELIGAGLRRAQVVYADVATVEFR